MSGDVGIAVDSIAIFAFAFYAQALDGVTIEVVLVFAFGDDEVFEAAAFVTDSPGVAEIAGSACASGVGKISDIGISDRLAVGAN